MPSGTSKLARSNTKPTVLISIGIQERTDIDGDTQEECSAKKKNRKHNQGWQFQKPFYVEEPQWIEIDTDYMDSVSRNSESADPYILSRGKKIFVKDPSRLNKMIEDYEEIFNYSSLGERLTTRNRVRRGVEGMDIESQNNAIDNDKNDQEEEKNHYNPFQDIDKKTNKIAMNMGGQNAKSPKIDEKSNDEKTEKRKENHPASAVRDGFKEYEKDKMKNIAKISSGDRKIMERYQENNPSKIEAGNDEKSKRLAFFKDKRSVEDHKKRGDFETEWKNLEGKKKAAAKFEQMENNPYIDKMKDLSTYDLFILSRGKKPLDNRAKSSKGKSTDKSIETRRKASSIVEYYRHRKNPESEEEARDEENEENKLESDKNDVETGDTRLMDNSNSRSSEIKGRPTHREKRNAYETRSELQRSKNMKKEILFSPYMKPQPKHNKIEEQLLLPTDPFFIIRGKKNLQEFEDNLYSMMEPRNEMNDADRAEMTNLSTQEDLLRMLLTKRSSCSNHNYDLSKLSRNKPRSRDRRGSLDKILNIENLKYDPFYVVRGKRMSENFRSNERSEHHV